MVSIAAVVRAGGEAFDGRASGPDGGVAAGEESWLHSFWRVELGKHGWVWARVA